MDMRHRSQASATGWATKGAKAGRCQARRPRQGSASASTFLAHRLNGCESEHGAVDGRDGGASQHRTGWDGLMELIRWSRGLGTSWLVIRPTQNHRADGMMRAHKSATMKTLCTAPRRYLFIHHCLRWRNVQLQYVYEYVPRAFSVIIIHYGLRGQPLRKSATPCP